MLFAEIFCFKIIWSLFYEIAGIKHLHNTLEISISYIKMQILLNGKSKIKRVLFKKWKHISCLSIELKLSEKMDWSLLDKGCFPLSDV